MSKHALWDWQTPVKEIPVKEWETRFNWVEDPVVTPDGEAVAAIVNLDEMAFGICVNGEVWEGEYEKAWSLKALPDSRFAAAVCADEAWSMLVDGQAWTEVFDFIWNLDVTPEGSHISLAYQRDMAYGMARNGEPWEEDFESITGMTMGSNGACAAVVQPDPMPAADTEAFAKGIFAVARDGVCFEPRFLNAWDLSFDQSGERLAWAVRLDRETYGVALDGNLWESRFQAVWKPVFFKNGLAAPVRTGGKWRLYMDDARLWDRGYDNIWHLTPSPDHRDLAAITATAFGQWQVSVNDRPWTLAWDTMIRDLTWSETGNCLAAVFKHNGVWDLAVNDKAWQLSCDKLFAPAMSRDGSVTAVCFERQGTWHTAVNGRVIQRGWDWMADPAVSPDGDKVLVKGIENGVYKRHVVVL